MKKKIGVLALTLFLFWAGVTTSLTAATLRVPRDYSTIQAAVDASVEGDTVMISPGIYRQSLPVYIREHPGVTLRGSGEKRTLIISSVEMVVHVENSRAEIADCLLKSGSGGFCIESFSSDLTVAGCDLENGGILSFDSTVNVENSSLSAEYEYSFVSNNDLAVSLIDSTVEGAEIWSPRSVELRGNTVSAKLSIQNNREHVCGAVLSGNTIDTETQIAGSVDAVVDRNLFRWAGLSVLEAYDREMIITNNTIVGGTGVWLEEVSAIIVNNIITQSEWSGIDAYGEETDLYLAYNDVWGNQFGNYGDGIPDPTGIEGNISQDPLFVNMDEDDYRLQDDSPCVDAGDPDTPVPEGGGDRVDMGAFEFENTPPEIFVWRDSLTVKVPKRGRRRVSVWAVASDPDGEPPRLSCRHDCPGAKFKTLRGRHHIGRFIWRVSPADAGSYRVTFTAEDGHGAVTERDVAITIKVR